MLKNFGIKSIILGFLIFTADAQARYAAIVIDAKTGQAIHQENPDKRVKPASLTKMMTLYKTFQALDRGALHFHQKLKVSRYASSQSPSKLGLKAGQTICVRDAILSLITKSANDMAVVLAEALGQGSEVRFASMMTHQAKQLGMSNTVFKNASGLPHKHQSTTARDMAKLCQALIRDFPHYYRYFATKFFTYRGAKYRNTNRLVGEVIGYARGPIVIDGIKTGFTNASGFNLAASARHQHKRLIGVVVGGHSRHWRDRRMKQLLSSAFRAQKAPDSGVISRAHLTHPKPSLNLASSIQKTKPLLSRELKRHSSLSSLSRKRPLIKTASRLSRKWGIQVGAFRQAKDAQVALKTVKRNMRNLAGQLSHVSFKKGKRKRFHQAQFIRMTHAQAKQACWALKRSGKDCFVIQG